MSKEVSAEEIKRVFNYKKLFAEKKKLQSEISMKNLQISNLYKKQEQMVNNEVELRTKKYKKDLKEKDKIIEEKDRIIEEKDKQILALKVELSKKQSLLDNDSTNSGTPTSKTPIGKKKYIPNTREKTDKKIGGQKNHKKHKLIPFDKEDITEEKEIVPNECPKCHSKNIEKLNTSVDKQELDYDVVLIKRSNKFVNCQCLDCGNIFHENIPNDLKEDIQYGKNLQSLAVCLTNEIYTPFNKTVKLVSGITDNQINMTEGYVTKLQPRAANRLDSFIIELENHIKTSPVYGWDDGVVKVKTKDAILRVYCTDNVVLLYGHENKNEAGLDEDGILLNTPSTTIVMHDHIIHNYNQKYKFDNVECLIHVIRRIKKMIDKTKHKAFEELIKLLSQTNSDRNKILKDENDPRTKFDDKYLEALDKKYDEILDEVSNQNEIEPVTVNFYKEEEENFIKDLRKYKRNYLLWAYDFGIPSTNNNSERNIRPVKSKMKISGQFQNINYLKYYAKIRSYIETCKKNGINIIDACNRLMSGNPYTLAKILKTDEE